MQSGLQALRTIGISKGRQLALRTVGNVIKNEAVKRVKNLFPVPDFLSNWKTGVDFTKTITKYICKNLDAPSELFVEVPIDSDGTPMADGFNCVTGVEAGELLSFVREGLPHADFVLGSWPPTQGRTWVVGELKSSLKTLYDQYGGNKGSKQFDSMMKYAAHHTHPRIALIICAGKGKDAPSYAVIQAEVVAKGVALGALPMVLVILD